VKLPLELFSTSDAKKMSTFSMMKHHQALFLILFFTLSFAGVELHKGDYIKATLISYI
jgi:hypothetical protein